MKIRITLDYEIPEDLQPLVKSQDALEIAQDQFIKVLTESGEFSGEFSLEHAEIIE